jgi:hypothetical protein
MVFDYVFLGKSEVGLFPFPGCTLSPAELHGYHPFKSSQFVAAPAALE